MNRIPQSEHYDWCSLEITNDDGERFAETDCPSHVKERIHRALARGEQQGIVCHAGQLWRWLHVVIIEIEDHGSVVQRIPVPWTSWQAFRLLAARRGFKAKEWLASHVAAGMAEGKSVKETVDYLLGPLGGEEWQPIETTTQAWEVSIA